mmetsp:Transcript_39245/g.94897  ORF Transcript_39245/g.94897 Transcript_39245/m.94897 type:complete len:206 (-) Transcript_39245:78-695(-)
MVPMLSPYPRYDLMTFARSFDAAATEIRRPLRSWYNRHSIPRLRSQNEQSAAPPAIVPRRNGLISMTFLTVPDEMYAPMVDRESTETMTPPWNLNANVVVPLANLTSWFSSPVPQTDAKLVRQNCAGFETLGISNCPGTPIINAFEAPAAASSCERRAFRLPMSRMSLPIIAVVGVGNSIDIIFFFRFLSVTHTKGLNVVQECII